MILLFVAISTTFDRKVYVLLDSFMEHDVVPINQDGGDRRPVMILSIEIML